MFCPAKVRVAEEEKVQKQKVKISGRLELQHWGQREQAMP